MRGFDGVRSEDEAGETATAIAEAAADDADDDEKEEAAGRETLLSTGDGATITAGDKTDTAAGRGDEREGTRGAGESD